jgi:aspartyl-tRNA(Asn)/glutamyl-tRNA(Gln) amidotransferase subunit A
MAEHDPGDHDSLPQPLAAFTYRGTRPGGRPLRIARLTNVFPHADRELHGAADRALRVLEQHGAQVSDAEIPRGPFEEAAELVILMEAASAFSDMIDSGLAARLVDPLGRINGYASREFSAQDYLHVQRVRLFLQQSIDRLFDRFDVISAPGQGDTADELQPSKAASESTASEPIDSLQPDAISSLCGLPAVTVPCGFDRNGMPVGVQFLARALDDQAALSAANLFQAHTDWHTRHPALT